MTISYRPAVASDTAAAVGVHRQAFTSDVEADLVSELLAHPQAQPAQSWVASDGGMVVGHVLLTPGSVEHAPTVALALLCPLAVLPTHQHAGVGTALTRAALDDAKNSCVRAVTVLGDPEYYARFGFASLLPGGPLPPFDVAAGQEPAWQTVVLDDDPQTRVLLEGARTRWADPLMTPRLWQG